VRPRQWELHGLNSCRQFRRRCLRNLDRIYLLGILSSAVAVFVDDFKTAPFWCPHVSCARSSLIFHSPTFKVRPLLLLGQFASNCGPILSGYQPIATVAVRQFKNLIECELRKACLWTLEMADATGSHHYGLIVW
jgi:hypothetical protein